MPPFCGGGIRLQNFMRTAARKLGAYALNNFFDSRVGGCGAIWENQGRHGLVSAVN
jgi:hypothetical protein